MMGNNFTEILLSEKIMEIDQQERVDSDSFNISCVNWIYILYNLR